MSQPTPPAGWYDDPSDQTIQRYWDGAAWTTHTAPKTAPAPPAATQVIPAAPAAPVVQSPQQAVGYDPSVYQSTNVAGQVKPAMSRKTITWIIVVVVAIVVIGMVSALIRGASDRQDRREPVAQATTSATPAEVAPEPSEEPVVEEPSEAPVPDATFFKTTANGHLDDYTKDLDDMVTTLDENGFFRLLTNEVELAFNVAQLQSLDVPAAVKAEWDPQIVALDAATTTISSDVSDEQYDTLRADLEAARGIANTMHDIANRAAP
ncbi:DUF2510 domain-containing protein [Leifsonia sp. Leaf264]|uniref:DUF2510 domain-containing protein n=1 Tax=Leifsonia sp. Leaf264 TaxID=1736314 RepID=UPI0006FDFA8E|nr:DUF2510 domain-containing protein [Leifsonia sp. Leaf264]KQO98681.1 hypothetical protein ASF30_11505 [Leifsonia sp. Leaf264]